MNPWIRRLLLIDVIKYHKMKIFMGGVFFVLMFIWIFPFSDLSDFVTDQVATQTQGQVFVQFGDLDFGLFPTLSLKGEDVILETATTPTLNIASIQFWPSITSLMGAARNPNEIPNFSLRARGLFDGDVAASVSNGKSGNKEVSVKNIEINAQNLNLAQLSPVASLPLKMEGQASLEGSINLDPQFRVQPEGDINLTGNKVRIPAGNVPTQMGPLFLPGFSWSSLNVKSRLSGGTIYLEQAVLGKPQDALYLQVKGQMRAPVQRGGLMVQTYDLRMDLQISPALARELGPFLSFIDRFKRSSGANSRYVFRAVSNMPGSPPDLMPLSSF